MFWRFQPPSSPNLAFQIDLSPYGASPNSVAVNKRGIVAVAVQNAVKTSPGKVVFFKNDGTFLNQLSIGALPDMLTYSPNGKWLLIANEGEPNNEYTIDPEGTISIVRTVGRPRKIANLDQSDIKTVDFQYFNNGLIDPNIRIFGPASSVAQDLEPEYIAISKNSKKAFVVLRENNAMAVIDIENAEVIKLFALGTKDHRILP